MSNGKKHEKTALIRDFLVELTGVEPASKSCPTFRRLQFSPLLDKT